MYLSRRAYAGTIAENYTRVFVQAVNAINESQLLAVTLRLWTLITLISHCYLFILLLKSYSIYYPSYPSINLFPPPPFFALFHFIFYLTKPHIPYNNVSTVGPQTVYSHPPVGVCKQRAALTIALFSASNDLGVWALNLSGTAKTFTFIIIFTITIAGTITITFTFMLTVIFTFYLVIGFYCCFVVFLS